MTLNPNQFELATQLGVLDLHFQTLTVSAIIDKTASAGSPLVAGQAVTVMDSAGGVPKVVAAHADTDEVFGFIIFDRMHQNFVAGNACEILQKGTMYLYAAEAIARGAQCSLDVTGAGYVESAAGNTGADIVGYAFDKAATAGLIRVSIDVPSFKKV